MRSNWLSNLIIFIGILCPTHPGSQAVSNDTIHPWNGLHSSNQHQKLINLSIKFEPVDLHKLALLRIFPCMKHNTSTTAGSISQVNPHTLWHHSQWYNNLSIRVLIKITTCPILDLLNHTLAVKAGHHTHLTCKDWRLSAKQGNHPHVCKVVTTIYFIMQFCAASVRELLLIESDVY